MTKITIERLLNEDFGDGKFSTPKARIFKKTLSEAPYQIIELGVHFGNEKIFIETDGGTAISIKNDFTEERLNEIYKALTGKNLDFESKEVEEEAKEEWIGGELGPNFIASPMRTQHAMRNTAYRKAQELNYENFSLWWDEQYHEQPTEAKEELEEKSGLEEPICAEKHHLKYVAQLKKDIDLNAKALMNMDNDIQHLISKEKDWIEHQNNHTIQIAELDKEVKELIKVFNTKSEENAILDERNGLLIEENEKLKAQLQEVYEAAQWGISHVGMANYASRESEANEKLDIAMYKE